MPNEQTPLIQTVIVATPRQRYPHSTLRRFCTIFLTCSLISAVILFVTSDLRPPHWRRSSAGFDLYPSQAWPESNGIAYKDLQKILLDTPKEDKARDWSYYYTSGPHLAGKNLSQAVWTQEKWQEFGVADTSIVAYDIYVNYPKGHRLALLESTEDVDTTKKHGGQFKVKYEAKLEEDVLKDDSTSGLQDRIPTFHGYSASGNVTAQYVYVNHGTYKDFEDLVEANISLAGKIALARYGSVFRGLKTKRAQELGMIGIIIYSDPGDDGDVTDENGIKTYPKGPAREPSSVQRGSTQYISIAPGDPTTPGYPSKPGVPRQSPEHSLPHIPSIPISYLDALPLLKALNGYGPLASSFDKRWHSGGLSYKGVQYNVGPSPPNLTVNLVNEQEYVTTPMWNVIGIINGTIPDEVIILGNHRDAWIAGGAADPNSGSAAFNEVVRGFGIALKAGWKPLRTIVMASWDGEEYGLIGSTEWVEEYIPWLSNSAIAYLNVDVGTSGPYFHAAAAPLLDQALIEVTQMVSSPNQTVKGQTVGDAWNGHIATMGSGSDFTAFQDYAGIPCIDMGFMPGPGSAVYHYHSNYDSFDWMDRFGDPGWHYHTTIAKLWGLLAIKLAESPIIQFNASNYASALLRYLDDVEESAGLTPTSHHHHGQEKNSGALFSALQQLKTAATSLDARAADLAEQLRHIGDIPWYKWWLKVRLFRAVRKVNSQYKFLERQFLYPGGLDGRSWFKHSVFAPGLWTGYAGATFPGIVESLQRGDQAGVRRWEGIITDQVLEAVELLKGN